MLKILSFKIFTFPIPQLHRIVHIPEIQPRAASCAPHFANKIK